MIRRFLRHPLGIVGLALVAVPTFAAMVSLFWTPYDPTAFVPLDRWLPPSPEHWLGTDAGGRDLFSILIAGAQATMLATVLATVIAIAVGVRTPIAPDILPNAHNGSGTHIDDIVVDSELPGPCKEHVELFER